MDLNKYDFTNADFEMLNDALENLPNKDDAGDMFKELLHGVFEPKQAVETYQAKLERERVAKQQKRKAVIENVRVLQAKLIMLRRDLQQENKVNDQSNSD